jgi:hypothetical protein
MKRLSQSVIALVAFFSVIVVFQNCAGYEPMTNPLYEKAQGSSCVGATCSIDLNAVQIKVMTGYGSQITVKKVATMSPGPNCDVTNCFDVAGYCDPGGYTRTKFFYQLTIGTSSTTIEPGVSCDSNGRFSFQVPLYSYSQFTYDNIYPLRVGMKVYDEDTGQWLENPSGLHVQNLSITGRTDATPTPTPTPSPTPAG